MPSIRALCGRLLVLALYSASLYNAYERERVPDFRISDSELRNFVISLRNADINKARPGQIGVNYQRHTSTRERKDDAPDRLFEHVDASLLRKPSYEKLIGLMDNYERNVGRAERETETERREISSFLTEVLHSRVWRMLYQFLNSRHHPYAVNEGTFRMWIGQLWFLPYSRARGELDTSGFEHTFIGEAKKGEVGGLHNWLRFYMLEKDRNARFDYKGFILKRFNLLAVVKYGWQNEWKKSGSFLIGTSPEFDMALYTLCFLSHRGRSACKVEIDGCPISVISHELFQKGRVHIGSVYPSAGRLTSECRCDVCDMQHNRARCRLWVSGAADSYTVPTGS